MLKKRNFDDISESDLVALIENRIAEGVSLEYKRETYGRTDSQKHEFLKDVSAFANSTGGHLVIGLAENASVAAKIVPIEVARPDQEIQRLEHLIRDGIEPRVSGIRVRAVPLGGSGFVIVIRIPASMNAPHRVRLSNRFYFRTTSGVQELGVEELRLMFTSAATARRQFREFRSDRLRELREGHGPVSLMNATDYIVLHILPMSVFTTEESVEFPLEERTQRLFKPMRTFGFDVSYRRNLEGHLATIVDEKKFRGYTQLHRNGTIEAVKAPILSERGGYRALVSDDIHLHVLTALVDYIHGLKLLKIPCPLWICMTLEGVRDAILYNDHAQFMVEDLHPFRNSTLLLPEVVVRDYGSRNNYYEAARPMFDAIWNAAGFSASRHFDPEGVRIGSKGRL
jgi:hypothetical protein